MRLRKASSAGFGMVENNGVNEGVVSACGGVPAGRGKQGMVKGGAATGRDAGAGFESEVQAGVGAATEAYAGAGAATETVGALLMVSGGSDSTALLEMACAYLEGSPLPFEAQQAFEALLPEPAAARLRVLHVNHLLRGGQAYADKGFVRAECEQMGVDLHVERVNMKDIARGRKGGVEAVSREERYRLAAEQLDLLCATQGCARGYILTAHTLDDRVETFFMRALVGTGPGGFASIPRERERVRRPLLDMTREELRDWLRGQRPSVPDVLLWREDASNDDGSNFRSRVRTRLVPVAEALRPGFARTLVKAMDLIADEDAMLQEQASSLLYRKLDWDKEAARLPVAALLDEKAPMRRRVLRQALLVVDPGARLESAQIERVAAALDAGEEAFSTEVAGGLRVSIADGMLVVAKPR